MFLEATSVCGDLGMCRVKDLEAKPTCHDCVGAVEEIAAVLASREKIDEIDDFLKVGHVL